jgi:lipid II:glycine glycyltransferase (peptidoglycan interpeptide bridge formation enzyme)
MALLAEHGFTAYNLGGTPEAGGMPEHPAHGLFRFKNGFGGEAVRCRGARWVLRPGHLRAHRLARALADLVRPRTS